MFLIKVLLATCLTAIVSSTPTGDQKSMDLAWHSVDDNQDGIPDAFVLPLTEAVEAMNKADQEMGTALSRAAELLSNESPISGRQLTDGIQNAYLLSTTNATSIEGIYNDLWVVVGVNASQGGRPGAKGDQGDPGPAGVPGPKGDTGDIGPQGIKGDRGDRGDQGPPGYRGPEGPAGPAGIPGYPGPEGPRGQKGDQGDIGPSGPTGPPGFRGLPGPKGSPGPQGEPGDSSPDFCTLQCALQCALCKSKDNVPDWAKPLQGTFGCK